MDQTLVQDAGRSFWHFVAQRYGHPQILSIINMTRISRSIETGFQYVLGITLETVYGEWLQYYQQQNDAVAANTDIPDIGNRMKGKRILKRNDISRNYSQFQVSPDGKLATLVTNESGKYKVWLHNIQTGKIKKLYVDGFKLDEKIDESYPLLAWHPSGAVLAMVLEKKGLLWLYLYDVDQHQWTKRNIYGFEKISELTYSPDGRSLLFSAVQKGQNDLFLFTISSSTYERLTYDIYDDLDPAFIQGNRIIFSSNRPTDTLEYGQNTLPGDFDNQYDLFIFDYPTRNTILRRVTNTPLADERQAMPYGDGYFAFLSDENGINNQYVGRLDSTVAFVDTAVHYRYFTSSFPITNYNRSIAEHHITPRAGYKAMIVNENLYDRLYLEPLVLPDQLLPATLSATPYILVQQQKQIREAFQIAPLPPAPSDTATKQPPTHTPVQRKSFRNVLRNDTYLRDSAEVTKPADGKINIENYQLSQQGVVSLSPEQKTSIDGQQSSLKGKSKDNFDLPKQRNYYTQYSINQLVTQIDFSYLSQMYQPYPGATNNALDNVLPGFNITPDYQNPGLSPTFMVGITDLMENYRILGGVRIGLDLVDKEYFFNFANLKNRLDKEFVFQRRSLEQAVIAAYVTRQKINEGFFILTYPLNKVLRVRGTFLLRNETLLFSGPDELAIRYPNQIRNWGGAKLQLIYDDTKELGLNLPEGTRFMLFGEYNQQIEQINKNLIVAGFDFRNYLRIHRQLIWANRLAGSSNFGTERLLYYMGGTDSWMLPSFADDTRIDPDQNWVYQALATNMRGFKQNARNGNTFLVLNSELRVPLFRYLLNKPIKSEFIKNFQLVGFGDIGTAWNGWNPYDPDNVLYTRYVNSGPLRIKVQYEKDPLIAGIGFGARTKVLGYFLKGDLSWGIEDGKVKRDPIFYLSMSLDF
jgi:Tol biopolymer transport system component